MPGPRSRPFSLLPLLLVTGCGAPEGTAPEVGMTPLAAAYAPGYSVPQDLGTFTGGTRAAANAISDSGMIVGRSDSAAGRTVVTRAARWWGGLITGLGVLPGDQRSEAWGVNGSGTIVGESCPGITPTGCHPFRWHPSTGMQPLAQLSPNRAVAAAINPAGVIVGGSTTAAGASHAVRWTAAGLLQDLHPAGAVSSFASDINTGGQITGYIVDARQHAWAYRWTPSGGGSIVGSLGGNSVAYAVDDSLRIAGGSVDTLAGGLTRPFLWSSATGTQPLASVPPGTWGWAADISIRGRIVGRFGPDGFAYRNGQFGTLPRLAGGTTQANAVSLCGIVVGNSTDSLGRERAVRWDRRACD